MRDLHVYIETLSPEARGGQAAFYSRRADGPFYRWLYAGGAGGWRYSRVNLDKPAQRVLCVARWDAVPAALRKRLGEHYLE
jgi:hypothetical protein